MGAAVLVGVGGAFVLLEGLVDYAAGTFFAGTPFGAAWADLIGNGALISIVALVILLNALLINAEPHHHVANGALALLLAAVSFVIGFGGFFLGGILVGVGGAAAMAWSPPRRTGPTSVRR